MNFFEHQRKSKKNTLYLVFLFILAMISIIVLTNMGIFFALSLELGSTAQFTYDWSYIFYTAIAVCLVVFLAKLFKSISLRGGGSAICNAMGAVKIDHNTKDLDERKLFNIVEEMSIASGVPRPQVFILEEDGINAFAAGDEIKNAAVCVTRGAIRCLTRDELQAVVAHEFGHIFNGDMKINIKLISWVFGITFLYMIGRFIIDLFSDSHRYRSRRSKKGGNPALMVGLVLLVIGYIGMMITRVIKAAISRQREYLADAAAVQYTRNGPAMASVLKKILAMSQLQYFDNKALEEVSHMCFANSFKTFFSTHPPAQERIKRIDKKFKFELFKKQEFHDLGIQLNKLLNQEISLNRPQNEEEGVSNFSSNETIKLTDEKIVQDIGVVKLEEIKIVQSIIEQIPKEIKELVTTLFGAKMVLVSFLFSSDEQLRNSQSNLIEEYEPELAQEVYKIFIKVQAIPKKARLPLLELAIAEFRNAPKESFKEFVDIIHNLINLDGRVEVFELLIYTMLYSQLKDKEYSMKKRVSSLTKETSIALSFVCLMSNERNNEEAHIDFGASMHNLKISQGRFYQLKDLSTSLLFKSFLTLDKLTIRSKEKLVKEYVRVINKDKKITYKEQEALALLCFSISLPMPILSE